MPTISGQSRQVPDVPLDPALRQHRWSELPGNLAPSAVDNATDFWEMATHPRQTAEGFIDSAQGTADRLMPETLTNFMNTYVSPRSAETKERQRRISGVLIQALKDRYWGAENLKDTVITDPVGSALDVIGIAGGGAGLLRRPLAKLARSPVNGLFNPKPKPQRPLVKDYPDGAELNEAGYITKDIEGRPLHSSYVAGRTRADIPDEGLTPLDIESVGGMGIEGPIDKVPANQLRPGSLGRTHVSHGRPTKVEILDSLPKAKKDIATAHEVGHVIDALAGQIPVKGLERELDFNYSALRTGEERKSFFSRPQDFGYKNPHLADRERVAEAIRAYMVDPNYLKTVAPNTAARIREYVNSHPELSKIIQFNSIAAGGTLGLGMAGQSENSQAAGQLARHDGLNQITQALLRRGISAQAPKTSAHQDIVRALMARKLRY